MEKVTHLEPESFYKFVGAIMEGMKKGASDDDLFTSISEKVSGYSDHLINSGIKKARSNYEKIQAKEREKQTWFNTEILTPILNSADTEIGLRELLTTEPKELTEKWLQMIKSSHNVIYAGISQAAKISLEKMVEEKFHYNHLAMSIPDAAKDIANMWMLPRYFFTLCSTVEAKIAQDKERLETKRENARKKAREAIQKTQAELAKKQEKKSRRKSRRKESVEALLSRPKEMVSLKGIKIPVIIIESNQELDLIGTEEFCQLSGIIPDKPVLVKMDGEYFWISKTKSGRTNKNLAENVSKLQTKKDKPEIVDNTIIPQNFTAMWVKVNGNVTRAIIVPSDLWDNSEVINKLTTPRYLMNTAPSKENREPVFYHDGRKIAKLGEARQATPEERRSAKNPKRGKVDWSSTSL